MKSPPAASRGTSRNEAIDFFRGLGLWIVLVDHLQPNVWSHFSLAQFGFSDFAEIFVFLSGYVNAGMYERALHAGGIAAAVRKLRSRAARLYMAHIATMAASFAIFGACASRGLRLDEPVLYVWMGDPARYLARTLFLLYSPRLYSLLPLYIVLAPFTLAAVVALRRWPVWALASSFALWCIALSRSADFPFMVTHEAWFFNPVAWQFLFVIGAASKMYWPGLRRAAESRTLQRLAIAVVLASFLLKTAILIGPLRRWLFGLTPLFARLLAHDAGKGHLAPFRLVHFLSLLILIVAIPCNWRKWLESRVARLAIAGGRDSLFIYSVTLVMTAALNLFLKRWDGGPLLQFACTALGLSVLCGLAYWRDKVPANFDLQPEQSRK
ncbi:MAG: OpgC domain-containing protein [Bryobacteraceae bacterium]